MDHRNQSNERSSLSNHKKDQPPSYESLYQTPQIDSDSSIRTVVQDTQTVPIPQTIVVIPNVYPGTRCYRCGTQNTLFVVPKTSIWQHYWAFVLFIAL